MKVDSKKIASFYTRDYDLEV